MATQFSILPGKPHEYWSLAGLVIEQRQGFLSTLSSLILFYICGSSISHFHNTTPSEYLTVYCWCLEGCLGLPLGYE